MFRCPMAAAAKPAVHTSPVTRVRRVTNTSLPDLSPAKSTTATMKRDSQPASFAPLVTLASSSYSMAISPVSLALKPWAWSSFSLFIASRICCIASFPGRIVV